MFQAPEETTLTPHPLTVAFINSTHKWGGVKSWTMDFGEALQARGHRVAAVLRPGTPFEDTCRQAGFAIHPVPFGPKYNPVAIFRVTRALRTERAAVAVVNISKDLNVGAVAARLLRIPVVHRVGSIDDYKGSREEELWHSWLVDRVLVPCFYLKNAITGRFSWARPEKIEVIPNSKRLDRYSPAALGPTPVPVFGVTGQLSSGRGHTHLLAAVQELVARGVRIRLRVAGVGPIEDELRREVRDRGVENTVELCGFQRDVPEFLRALDGFVLPSLKEAFPNTVLEALCTGLPVVASNLEGIREMVGDAAILVPPRDEGAIMQAMERLATDYSLRVRLGTAARRRAEEKYDVTKTSAALVSLFRSVQKQSAG